ncbi:UNKNOWN [Stylonychia lemnae]|uniref:Uncharacterized protein n=1 Tax=Stylonychia lemnae TaxID=5949 RepID=A0A078A333_STYLE|nr:UNKNOWN [Stylonychia lemnae]|eukprot:CDW76572.1 UNKNOWN [Stylonychia lemnae]
METLIILSKFQNLAQKTILVKLHSIIAHLRNKKERNNYLCTYEKKLLSLMSGSDLCPLQEEVSKEDDDSVIIKVDVQKQQTTERNSYNHQQNSARSQNSSKAQTHRSRQSNKSNPYFPPQQNQNQYQNYPNVQIMNGHESNRHSHENVKSDSEQNLHSQASSQSLLKANSMKTSSSYVSGDYNYSSNMEEAQLYEFLKNQQEEESLSPKLFDQRLKASMEENISLQTNSTATHNTSGSSQNQQMLQDQLVNDFNYLQKEKAKKIIESLKAQAQKPSPHSIPNIPKVEKRLFDYQKKLEEKIELQRKQKQQLEMQQLRPIPQICDKTNEILMKKSMIISHGNINPDLTQSNISNNMSNHFSPKTISISPNRSNIMQNQGTNMFPIHPPLDKSIQGQQQIIFQNYQIEQKGYYEELKRKEELRQKIIEEKELQGFTGKPQINKKSQMIKRKVDDLIEWKDVQDKKREEELKKKAHVENQEIQQFQQVKVVNKQSEKMIENRYKGQRGSEKVEDRLLRDASLRQKKQQKQQVKQIFYISDLEGKKSNTSRIRNRSQSNHQRQQNAQRPSYQLLNQQRETSKSRNRSPQYASQQNTLKENSINQDMMNNKFDQRIFSQSVEAPNQYNQYGSTSPSNSNNYQFTNNTQVLSPYAQSARSGYSTNPFNNSYFNNQVSEQISQHQISQMSSQIPQSQISSQNQQQFNYAQPLINPQIQQMFYSNNIGGGSFDLNQYQNTQQQLNHNFSPQKMYQQMINSQNFKQNYNLQNSNLMPIQQISYFDQSQSQLQNISQMHPTQILQVSNISQHRPSLESQGTQLENLSNFIQYSQGSIPPQYQYHNPTLINHYQGQSNALNNGQMQQRTSQQQYVNQQQQQQQQFLSQQTQNIQNVCQQQAVISPQNRNAFQEIQNMERYQQSANSNLPLQMINQNKHCHKKQDSLSGQPSQSNNSKKTKKTYESLFDKVQRMNVSQTSSDFDSCHSSQTVPIVSANGNQIYPSSQSPCNQQNNPITSGEFTCNPIIQKIQPESQLQYKTNPLAYDLPLQQLQSQPSTHQIKSFNTIDPSFGQNSAPSNIHEPTQTQDAYLQSQISQALPFTYQNPLYMTSFSGLNKNLLFQTNNQDQIINKILDNSFIPSGNVNQSRRVSKGCDIPQLQTMTANNNSAEFNDVYKEIENRISNEIPIQYQSRNTADQGQLLDTDFIITNTSRGSDQNIVRNLNKVLSQEAQALNLQKSVRSQSEAERQKQLSRNISPQKQFLANQSTKDSTNNLKNMNFMDRNSQWLEHKKYRLEKAKAIHDQQQERECPFKPQIKPITVCDKLSGQQNQRSRSLRSSTVSQEKSKSVSAECKEQNKNKNSMEREIQVNNFNDQDQMCLTDMSAQRVNNFQQDLNSTQRLKDMLQFNDQKIPGLQNSHNEQLSNLAKKRSQLINDIDDLDISGQCDITTLSPDPKNQLIANESNFETSFLSSQEKDQTSSSDRNNNVVVGGFRAGQVKILNKKMIYF